MCTAIVNGGGRSVWGVALRWGPMVGWGWGARLMKDFGVVVEMNRCGVSGGRAMRDGSGEGLLGRRADGVDGAKRLTGLLGMLALALTCQEEGRL